MRRAWGAVVVAAAAVVVVAGCQSTVFHATVPKDDHVAILISNEPLERARYEVKGIVVAERINYFIDAWGFITTRETGLGDALGDDLEDELFARARKLKANALVDVRVIDYKYHSGCGADAPWIPFGYASMAVQATAIRILDEKDLDEKDRDEDAAAPAPAPSVVDPPAGGATSSPW